MKEGRKDGYLHNQDQQKVREDLLMILRLAYMNEVGQNTCQRLEHNPIPCTTAPHGPHRVPGQMMSSLGL